MDDILLQTIASLLGVFPLNSLTGGGPSLWVGVGVILLLLGLLRGVISKKFNNSWNNTAYTLFAVAFATLFVELSELDMVWRSIIACIEVTVVLAIGVLVFLDACADNGFERKLHAPITFFAAAALFAVMVDVVMVAFFDGKYDVAPDAFWSIGFLLAIIFFPLMVVRKRGELKQLAEKLLKPNPTP